MRKTIFFTLIAANALFLAWRLGYLDSMIPSGHEPARLQAQFNADKVQRVTPTAASSGAPATPEAGTTGTGGGTNGINGTNGTNNTNGATGSSGASSAGGANAATPRNGTAGGAASPAGPSGTGNSSATGAPPAGGAAAPAAPGASPATAGTPGTSRPPAAVSVPAAPATTVPPLKPVVASATASCVDVSGFNSAEAKRFEAQLTAAIPGAKLSRRDVQETSSQMVFIPPQGSREGAEKKVAELRRLGITDLYVIQDDSPQRWGISLGIFRSEEAARAHLTALMHKGVRTARLLEHHVALTRLAYRVEGLDAAASTRLDGIRPGYSRQDWRSCQ